jgi:hypothetical protein
MNKKHNLTFERDRPDAACPQFNVRLYLSTGEKMSIEVSSVSELKEAIEAGENEIVSYNEDVVNKLKAIKLAKSWGQLSLQR